LIDADHIRAELGELVIDPELRPANPKQLTLFKSVGVAVQDAVAASAALEGANQRGLGTVVDW
jgi:ornithine cyclodeaminase/alanine dehydrogenase-like protein (mu-crystallin family)